MNYTQLYINDQEVDLSGVDKISLVFAINDIREIGNRDSDKSRTIEIPGTKTNHIIFGHAFNINSQGNFNPEKRAKALLKVNGIINMEGICILNDCQNTGLEQKFIINLYGGHLDWLTLIGDKELTDLDLSDYSHVWNGVNIRNSFVNTEGYTYSLIDWGRFSALNTTDNLEVTDFFPEVFIWPLVQKIFRDIDYTIIGGFGSDPNHKALTIPFTFPRLEHSDDWKKERDYEARMTTAISVTSGPPTKITFDINSGSIYWDSSTNRYTANEKMTFTIKFDTEVILSPANGISIRLGLNGGTPAAGSGVTNTTGTSGVFTHSDTLSITMEAGDYLEIYADGDGFVNFLNITSDMPKLMMPGSLIRINEVLPKIKQVDLIKALFQAFGIIFQTDENAKSIQLDVFNQFYKKPDVSDSGSFVDWSNKLDLSAKIERKFIFTNYGRNNMFQWKQDKDDSDIMEYIKTRGFPFNTGFGNGSYNIDSEVRNQKEIIADLPFASTWMVDSFNSRLHLPSIKRLIDGEYKGTPEPRLLIHVGSVSVESLTGNPNYTTLSVDGVTVSNIGYSYFWKKYYNDTTLNSYELNLYFDNELIQYGVSMMDKYYFDLLQIITSKRLISCWVTLNELDIANLDFGKAIYISYFRSYFILNKINDYVANNNHEPCQIELIPIG